MIEAMSWVESMTPLSVALVALALGGCGTASAANQDRGGWHVRQGDASRVPTARRATPVALPDLPGRASCKQARAAYVEHWSIGDDQGMPDLTAGQLAGVLGDGHYLAECRVPSLVEVSICAAVQQGRALGVTVVTRPRAPRLERCVDAAVRELGFPVHPRMDVTQTVFRAQG
jgi:hypothetical protein